MSIVLLLFCIIYLFQFIEGDFFIKGIILKIERHRAVLRLFQIVCCTVYL